MGDKIIIGLWGDKFVVPDNRVGNIKIIKKDNQTFYLSMEDIKEVAKFLRLLEELDLIKSKLAIF